MKNIHGKRLEHYIVEIMIDENCTFAQAMDIVFSEQNIDTNSVFDLVEFLEEHLETLDDVSEFMDIYTGKSKDFILILESINFDDLYKKWK